VVWEKRGGADRMQGMHMGRDRKDKRADNELLARASKPDLAYEGSLNGSDHRGLLLCCDAVSPGSGFNYIELERAGGQFLCRMG
jgi:hypothetical protein